MNKLSRTLAIILLCAIAAHAQDKKTKELDAFIKRGIADWQIPGLAVTVVKDGEAVFTKTYGVRNQDDGTKVDEHTLFSMASTTKAMVAMAMAMLVDEGKISWTDKVTDHVPYFKLSDPYITADATVKDLLTHNLGLGNADLIWYGIDLDAEETIKRMRHAPMAYPLRGGYTYQNIMYAVAGEVIKSASGVEWHEFVKARILDPLGMNDTKLVSKDVLAVNNRVTAHLLNSEDRRVTFPTTFGDGIGPAGMIWSSISDINKYLKFIQQKGVNQGDTLIRSATFEYLFTPQALIPQSSFYPTIQLTKPHWTSYGLGWFQHDYKGEKVDFHTGSLAGLIAINGQLRDHNLSVYVFGNMDHAELRHAIMYKVFDLYALGGDRDWHKEIFDLYEGLKAEGEANARKAKESRVEGTKTTLELAAYAGTYKHPMYGEIIITQKGDKLHFNLNNKHEGLYEHWHYNTFSYVGKFSGLADSQFNFEISAEGKAKILYFWGYEFVKE